MSTLKPRTCQMHGRGRGASGAVAMTHDQDDNDGMVPLIEHKKVFMVCNEREELRSTLSHHSATATLHLPPISR